MNGGSTLNNLVGIFSERAPPALDEVQAMLAELPGAERGVPRWQLGAALVSCETSCASGPDSSEDAKPAVHESPGDVAVLLDGHIENRTELERELGLSRVSAHELVRRAYERFGQDVVGRLRGALAVVIVDARRHRVLLGRDAVGVRPLYFVTQGVDGIAFASLPCALVAVRQVSAELDRETLLRELVGIPSVAPTTCFRHVSLVPRGTVVRFDGERTAPHRYWWPGAIRPVARAEEGYVEEFRTTLERSTASKLAAASRPIGVTLSGGLDSASVVAIARRLVGDPTELLAVTALLPGQASGDAPFARAVAESCGVPWVSFGPEGCALPDDFVRNAPNPAVAAHGGLLLEISRRAAAGRCAVVLTGTMGDFVGGSTPNWRVTLLHEGGPRRLWRELRADDRMTWLGRLRASAASLVAYGAAFGLVPRTCVPDLRVRDRDASDFIALTETSPGERRALAAELRTYLHGWETPHDDMVSYCQRVMDRGTDHEFCLLDLVSRHLGLEFRHPFADRELMDLLAALPWGLRRVGGLNRVVQRRAMDGLVAQDLLERREKLYLADYFSGVWRRQLGEGTALGPASRFVSPTAWPRYLSERMRLSYPVLTTMNRAVALDRWLAGRLARAPSLG